MEVGGHENRHEAGWTPVAMKSKPFQLPEEGFSQEEESGFRNELMNRVEGMSAETGSIADLSNPIASSSVKRQLLSAPPLGQVEVDENFQALGLKDASGYMNASKPIANHTLTGYTRNANQWVTPPAAGGSQAGWTLNSSSDWSESSQQFSYSGDYPPSGSRIFSVSYEFSLYGYASVQYWRMLGKLTKTPSGGSVADVSGSIQSDSYYGSQIAFGVYFMVHNVSGTSLVSLSSGDTLGFQYGHYCSNASSGTFNVGNLQSLTGTSGISITAVPVDQ